MQTLSGGGNDHTCQSLAVEDLNIPNAVSHVHSNLLPTEETQVPLFQNGLVLVVVHSFDGGGDLLL